MCNKEGAFIVFGKEFYAFKLTILKNKSLTLQDGGKEKERGERRLVSTLTFPRNPFGASGWRPFLKRSGSIFDARFVCL